MKIILLTLLLASLAWADTPGPYLGRINGADVQFTRNILDLNNIKILSGTDDPTATAPEAANQGSLYIRRGGTTYIKQDNGVSTNWTPVSTSTGGTTSRFTPYGSWGVPLEIDPTVGVSVSIDDRQLRFIVSTGGAALVTASPQIASGTNVGQELLLRGVSDADYIILTDGNGLLLNGQWKSKTNSTLTLVWDGLSWFEKSRR